MSSIALLGTASSVGKTTISIALCHYFATQGRSVAPFKAFNLSNNSFEYEGSTIGYAQYLQAIGAGVAYQPIMNPLLNSYANNKSIYYVNGKQVTSLLDEEKSKIVKQAYQQLISEYELVIVEGSGAMLELNLLHLDLANLSLITKYNIPTILVANISHGGVFGNIYGHLNLLTKTQRALIKGVIINEFAGDPNDFVSGVAIIEELCNIKVIGVIPKLEFDLPQEDTFDGDQQIYDLNTLQTTIQNLTTKVTSYLDMEYINQLI